MMSQADENSVRLSIDCADREALEVLSRIAQELAGRVSHPPHTMIVLENLGSLRGSVVGLLTELTRRIVGSQRRACLVDASGFASAFVDQHTRALPIAAVDSEAALSRRKRILVVEDSEDGLDFLRTLLESAGHECETARTARQACRVLDEVPVDLVLLDLVLPDADGLAVARYAAVRNLAIPIVAVSGYLDRWPEDLYARSGIRRRLSKPVRIREVLEAVHES